MKKLILMATMLLISGAFNAQNKCNGYILKLKNGTIEKYDAGGVNKQSSMMSNIMDFDCNEKEIAVIKTDGSVAFYDHGGNIKFSCGRGAKKIKYLDSNTYVITKEDGSMRKYEVGGCNDRGSF
jgi:hypothetical protein